MYLKQNPFGDAGFHPDTTRADCDPLYPINKEVSKKIKQQINKKNKNSKHISKDLLGTITDTKALLSVVN